MSALTVDGPPAGWRQHEFAEIADSIADRVDDPTRAGVDHYVGLEHLDSGDITLRRWGHPSDVSATKLRFREGDVIYGRRRAYQRKLAVAPFEGIASAHSLILRARPDVCLPEFLPYFLQSDVFHERAVGISVGSLSPTINWRTLKKQPFALPPLDEQRRIIEVLEVARDVCERWLDAVQRSELALSALLEQSIAADYAEGRTTNLGAAADIKMGRIYPSGEYLPIDGEGVRLVRPGNLAPDGRIDWAPDASVRLPDDYAADPRTVTLSAGDVIMNLTAQTLDDDFLGRVCLLSPADAGSILNQRIARLRPATDDLLGEYLFAVLRSSRFRRHTDTAAQGSKIKHLYLRDIEGFRLPVVRRHRQEAVCQEFAAAEALLEHATAHLHEARSLLVLLRESSLRGRS